MVNCLLKLRHALDITELGFGSDCVIAAAATETTEDVARFLLSPNLD